MVSTFLDFCFVSNNASHLLFFITRSSELWYSYEDRDNRLIGHPPFTVLYIGYDRDTIGISKRGIPRTNNARNRDMFVRNPDCSCCDV